MSFLKASVLSILFFLSLSLNAQTPITISGTASPTSAAECTKAILGNSVQLMSSASCALDIEIKFEKGPAITGLGSVIDTIKSDPYTLTFDSVGVYYFVCLSNSKIVADQCYNVEAVPVPTVSEWGLIILSLLLLSIGIVAIRSSRLATQKSSL